MSRPIDLVLSRLDQFKLRGDGRDHWRSCCPAHGGSNPSTLSIGVGQDDAVLLSCWAGCDVTTVAHALGLELQDLFPPKPDAGRGASPIRRRRLLTADGVGHQRHELPAAPTRHETLSEFGRELWEACRPIAGDALAYLTARACVIPPIDGHLRYHPALKHPPSGMLGPALVALVTDAITGQPLTLHRTWIRADGNKAPLDPPRMLLGGHRKAGGVVRLWPDEAVTMGLGIAEGIETALSLAHAFTPVWACIDAGNLAALPPLVGIESLLIAADHDQAGIAAAEACAARWVEHGREASIVMPDAHKTDLNDMARAA